MADIKFDLVGGGFGEFGEQGERGERGERGKRGERGERGERGHEGPTGPTGPSGTTGSTGPTGPTGPSVAPVIAAAVVNSNGVFISEQGFTGITHTPGSGVYVLTLANPPLSSNDLAVVVTQANILAGQVSYLAPAANQVEVHTFDAAGLAADRIFTVIVHDLS